MNQLFSFLLWGGTPGSGSGQTSLVSMLPILAIVAVFYFLIIRPQNKKQKETQRMLKELKKGDRVVTIGGIHGVIQSVRESTVILRIDENCKVEFARSAVGSVESQAKEKEDNSETSDES
ncbi:MAG: preprotein translocase subunit YajC [Treponema sp.]|jgi:preprotein translocase subunit YajC|nr:preprotein translocase subunit YajC [Treponema sp.]